MVNVEALCGCFHEQHAECHELRQPGFKFSTSIPGLHTCSTAAVQHCWRESTEALKCTLRHARYILMWRLTSKTKVDLFST
jgi:hypothetical protein